MNAWWTKYLPEILREWLEGRQQLQKTIGNTGWLLFDRILRIIIGLTIGAWTARYLGPAQFGELAYVISFIAFFQVVADLQADGFIVRDIAQEKEDPSIILGTALRLRLLIGTFSWLLAIAVMAILHPADSQLILLSSIIGASLVFRASDTVDLWFQSQSQSKLTVFAKVIAYLFSNIIRVSLLIWKAPLVAFAGVLCLEWAALALALAIAYRRFPTRNSWKAGANQAKVILHQCWPFLISAFLMTAFSRFDQIMLKELMGERELGIYAAAIPISQIWTVIPVTLVTSIGPFVARRKYASEELYQETLVSIFRYFALISSLSAIITAFASPWIIRIMYGELYKSSALVLSIYVFSNVFTFQGIAQSLWVTNDNVRTVTLIGTLLSTVICVASNTLMIRKFGTIGAAYTIVLVECISIVIIPCLLRKDLMRLYKRAFSPI
jgi:O-antigen/teichoic acid export membrane protein